MGKGKLTKNEQDILMQNSFVSSVDENSIIYTNEFKFHFIEQYNKGKKPTEIFREAGFDPKILGAKRIERSAYRWKKSYESGDLGKYLGRLRNEKKYFCEWDFADESKPYLLKTSCNYTSFLRDEISHFLFCPYCGKKIKLEKTDIIVPFSLKEMFDIIECNVQRPLTQSETKELTYIFESLTFDRKIFLAALRSTLQNTGSVNMIYLKYVILSYLKKETQSIH